MCYSSKYTSVMLFENACAVFSNAGRIDAVLDRMPWVAAPGASPRRSSTKEASMTIKAQDFRPDRLPRGSKYEINLEVEGFTSSISLPLLLVRGNERGKTLVATAGVH